MGLMNLLTRRRQTRPEPWIGEGTPVEVHYYHQGQSRVVSGEVLLDARPEYLFLGTRNFPSKLNYDSKDSNQPPSQIAKIIGADGKVLYENNSTGFDLAKVVRRSGQAKPSQ